MLGSHRHGFQRLALTFRNRALSDWLGTVRHGPDGRLRIRRLWHARGGAGAWVWPESSDGDGSGDEVEDADALGIGVGALGDRRGVGEGLTVEAPVPQWTSPAHVPPELLAWWQVMLEHIRQHEGEHIRIFADFVNSLPARVAGQPCNSWEAIVNAWSADLVSAQASFDAVEAGWVAPRYS